MVSSGVRQALKLAAALLALAAFTSALHAADGADADAIAARQQQLLATIQEILARDGPYAPELLGPLTALIELYQENDDDALAAVTIERARQVVRVNNGLHTLEQVPYIEQLIRIERTRGNDTAAWDLQQELLALVRRYPEDLRTVPVLREDAERHMDVLASYLRGERPAELYLGCYYSVSSYGDTGNCDSGSRGGVVQGMVADAQRSYSEAIAVLLRNELYDSDELREFELELLRGIDLVRTMNGGDNPIGLWRSRSAPIVELAGWDLPYLGSKSSTADETRELETKPYRLSDTYNRGRQSLSRLYAYDAAASRPLLSQASAIVQMADWELLHSNNGDAVNGYRLVRAALQRAGTEEASIDELFSPTVPVVLPAFQPNPLARDETRDETGHIDVAFEITKYGRGRAIEILDAKNATRDAKARLVSLIALSRFRPRPTNGEFVGDSRVVVRYYLYD
jgi:hypothetical protein